MPKPPKKQPYAVQRRVWVDNSKKYSPNGTREVARRRQQIANEQICCVGACAYVQIHPDKDCPRTSTMTKGTKV